MPEEGKGLTENELQDLRTRFKRRQNKFATITGQTQIRISASTTPQIAALFPSAANYVEEEEFENVGVEINPIIVDGNKELMLMKERPSLVNVNKVPQQKRRKSKPSKKSSLVQPKGEQRSSSKDVQKSKTFSRLNYSKSSNKINKVTQSKAIASKKNLTNKSEISTPSLVSPKKGKCSKRKSSETISTQESKTSKIKSVETQPKKLKREIVKNKSKAKEQIAMRKNKEKKKERDSEELKICDEKLKLSGNQKKENIEEMKKKEQIEYEMKKIRENWMKKSTVHENEKGLGAKNEEIIVETSKKSESKPQNSKFSSNESSIKAGSLPTDVSLERNLLSASGTNLLLKPIEMTKKDQLLYEKLDDEIILDTNLLQSLATDLVKGSDEVNKDVIGEDMAKKLIEIEKKDQSPIEQDHIKEEKEIIVPEIAKKIVEALTSNHVLGKVLTPEEATILRDYFSRKIPLSEKVLATLDTALDKILRRAHEFYDDMKELEAFLKDRDSAKRQLLDALIVKKSNYLTDLMTDASFYADQISKGLIDVYKLATEGILVARENLQYVQDAVGHTYRYSKDIAYRGAALTYETAARGKELAEIGASVGAKMTYDAAVRGKELAELGAAVGTKMTSDAAKMTLDAAIRGKELAERSAAVGTKMTVDAAKMTLDAAMRGKELAELGAAIGSKVTSDAARITLDAAMRGKELAERGAAIGTKVTADAAKMTLDAAMRGKELAELGAAVGTKMTSDAAKMTLDATKRGKEIAELGITIGAKITQDATYKGLQIAEGTLHVASKGTEMVKDGLTAASNTTREFSEAAVEGASQVNKLVQNVGEQVKNLTDAANQAKSEIQKSSAWLLSFLQSPTSETSGTAKEDDENDSSDDSSDKIEFLKKKNGMVNQ